MTENEGIHHEHEREKNGLKSFARFVWTKWKSRRSSGAMQTAIKAVVAASVSGGLAVGAIGYSQALDAKKELAAVRNQIAQIDLGNGVIGIPPAPDLTDAVQRAQSSADNAQGSADDAAGSATEAKNSAGAAQTSADTAQDTANDAINAVPRLVVFPNTSVNRLDPPWANAGTATIHAGTYVVEFGITSTDNSQVRLYFSDGRVISTPNGAGFHNGKALMTFTQDTTATIQVDSLVYSTGSATYTGGYILTTKVQAGDQGTAPASTTSTTQGG